MEKLREFENCADAVQALQEDAEKKISAATTHYEIKDIPAMPKSGMSDGKPTYEITVYWQVDWASMTINMPSYSWPDMSDGEKAAVKGALGDLLAHEEGHVDITEAYIAELSKEPIQINGTGATPTAATEDCSVKLAIHEAQTIAELRRRQEEYDDKTQHGVKQSEIGGVDVVLICPSK